ncbi:MAG: DMT family transporter [Kangiellaceae bacterium]|nr:DMT family transporter [Kangiellaceae bacterium]MCW9000674.1 DMT family transporter [Kangiellaceae bacterium]MCW9017583.1 DMT family transporter [Kangiellaceae bacterium]
MFGSKNGSALLLVSTIAVVALVTVLAKQTLNNVHYFSFVWLQMLIASLVMLIFTFGICREKLSKANSKVWLYVVAIGLLNFAIVRSIFLYTLDLLPVTTHAYLINFVGIVTMAFSALMLREPPSMLQIIGAAIAISGVRLYFWESPSEGELHGIAWLLIAVISLALTNILMRRLHQINNHSMTNNQVSTFAIIFGALPLVVWGLQDVNKIDNISVTDWLVISLNGIVCVGVVMLVFNFVLRVLKAYEASILATSGVVFTALFSIVLLNDSIRDFEILGIAVMISGIGIVHCFSCKQKPD